MRLQAAITKAKQMRTEAFRLQGKALRFAFQRYFVNVDASLYNPLKKEKTFQETKESMYGAMRSLAHSYDLKIAVQRENVDQGLYKLIQEMEFMKALCSLLASFEGREQKTDPQPYHNATGKGDNVIFSVDEAMYDVEMVEEIITFARERIREIQEILELRNQEISISIPEKGDVELWLEAVVEGYKEKKRQSDEVFMARFRS